MGYFLQKLAEEAEEGSGRSAKSTALGALTGLGAGAATGAAGLGLLAGGRAGADKLLGVTHGALQGKMRKRLKIDKPNKTLQSALWHATTDVGNISRKSSKSLAKHLSNLKGAAKYAIPATALAGLIGGGYALGKD